MTQRQDQNRAESTLSIAMCTYNGEEYLREQLGSIAKQSRLPNELVVSDDGSGDATLQILEEFQRVAPFSVQICHSGTNLGSTKNFEKAIMQCSGDIIVLCDQDDVWHSEKLMRIERIFVDSPHIGAVFTDGEICDAFLNPLGYSLWQSFGFNKKMQKKAASHRSFEVLIKRNVATGATTAFRSEFKDLVLPIPNEWVHDCWIALLIAAVSDLAIIDELMIKYRQHNSNQIGALKKGFKEQLIIAHKTTANDYWLEAKQFIEAKERLLATDKFACSPKVICHLSLKIRHLQARASMREQDLKRWIFASKELLTLRYYHYSNGWKSFAKDFFGA